MSRRNHNSGGSSRPSSGHSSRPSSRSGSRTSPRHGSSTHSAPRRNHTVRHTSSGSSHNWGPAWWYPWSWYWPDYDYLDAPVPIIETEVNSVYQDAPKMSQDYTNIIILLFLIFAVIVIYTVSQNNNVMQKFSQVGGFLNPIIRNVL